MEEFEINFNEVPLQETLKSKELMGGFMERCGWDTRQLMEYFSTIISMNLALNATTEQADEWLREMRRDIMEYKKGGI